MEAINTLYSSSQLKVSGSHKHMKLVLFLLKKLGNQILQVMIILVGGIALITAEVVPSFARNILLLRGKHRFTFYRYEQACSEMITY